MKLWLLILLIILMVLVTSADDAKNRSLEERGDLFEGDVMLTKDQKRALDVGNDIVLHNAKIDGHWPKNGNGHVAIPYKISNKFTYGQRRVINKALKEYSKNTCIRFVPKSRNDYYVRIMMDEPRKCWSAIGNIQNSKSRQGFQNINLARRCFKDGIGM